MRTRRLSFSTRTLLRTTPKNAEQMYVRLMSNMIVDAGYLLCTHADIMQTRQIGTSFNACFYYIAYYYRLFAFLVS